MTTMAPAKHPMAAVLVRVIVFVLVSSATLNAQRKSTLGTTIDFLGGADDSPRTSSTLSQTKQMEPFFALLPSITLESLTERSSFNLNYGYGWQRTQGTQKFDSRTHTVSAGYTNHFSPRWRASINESFALTDDVQTFYALRGVLPTPEGLTYVFSPVALEQSSTSNSVGGALDYSVSQKSGLAFSAGYSLRDYPGSGPGLSDQQSANASVTYTRKTSEHTSWNFGYTGSFYAFSQFEDSTSNAGSVGMSTQFAKETSFAWSIGISQSKSRQSSRDFAGYLLSAGLQRTIKGNFFHLDVSQNNSSTGLGGLSQTRQAGLGFSRSVGRKVNIFANGSFFDGQGILDNPFDTRGASATANVGFALSRKLSLQVGGQYQRYMEPVIYRFTQKRLFVSLRFTQPNLWRSH
jgi:hypothetical protein